MRNRLQFISVAQSYPTLCNPTDCSMSGLPVHHQLPELTQTHVHGVGDAVQPSHSLVPFSSCLQSFPASGSFPMSQFFASGGHSIRVSGPSNEHPGLISFRIDWLDLLATRDSQKSSPTSQFTSINSLVLSFLYSSTLKSMHGYMKNHSFD